MTAFNLSRLSVIETKILSCDKRAHIYTKRGHNFWYRLTKFDTDLLTLNIHDVFTPAPWDPGKVNFRQVIFIWNLKSEQY